MNLKKIILIGSVFLVILIAIGVIINNKRKFRTDLISIKNEQNLNTKFENITNVLIKYGNILNEYNKAYLMKDYKNKYISEENLTKLRKEAQEKVKELKWQAIEIKYNLTKIPLNIKNNQGQIPLMLDLRISPIVFAMDKRKARDLVNETDNYGKTVLQYLIDSPYFGEIAYYVPLLMHGAKVYDKDIQVAKLKLENNYLMQPIVHLLELWQQKNK